MKNFKYLLASLFLLISNSVLAGPLVTNNANTVVGATTANTPASLAIPSCSSASSALQWVSGTGFQCGSITGSVSTTGSPASGNLTKFSGASSITNGDLTGDVTTSGTLATTIANSTVTNAKMANMATVTVKSNITGGSAAPVDNTVTAILDTIGATQGSILYRGASVWTALTPGSNGQVLTSAGAAANPSWAGAASAGTAGSGTLNYSDNGITVTAGTYYAPIGGGGATDTTEANVNVKAPSAMTVGNLQVNFSAAPGTGNSYTITLRKGGVDQAATCTISNSATSCQDLIHNVAIAQNDLIDWKVVSAGTLIGTPTITITATSGAVFAGATVIQPSSYYTSDAAGNLFPNIYTGGGGNAAASESGWGVTASLGSNVALQMRFQMPSVIPPGTFKLVSYCMANASSGVVKYTISDADVANGSSPSAASLTGETQTSITWTAADVYVVTKTTLSSVPLAGDVSVVAATFNTTGWTLAQPLTCRWVELWE